MKEVIADTLAAMGQLFKERNIEVDGAPAREGLAGDRRPRPHDPGDAQSAVERGEVLRRRATAGSRSRSPSATAACAWTCATTAGASAREHQGEIFSKFRQVGDTLTDKPQGSGLGLHISRQIVEHFGGRMWVESEPGAARASRSRCRSGRDARAA